MCAQPLASGGIPPNYLDFQGILYDLSNSICYMQTGALWPWSSTLTYPLGAHVLGSDNNEYVAVQENTGQDPTTDSSGATWQNVSTIFGTPYLPLAGGTMTGALTLKGDPTENLQAATKQYVDNAVSGNLTGFIGMIAPFASTNLPEGWMICDGSSVLFADWPEFKTAYDEGRFTGMTVSSSTPAQVGKFVLNGSTGVYLPDLEGLFVQASAAGTAGAYVAPGLPNITGNTIPDSTSACSLNNIINSTDGAIARYQGNVAYSLNLQSTPLQTAAYSFGIDASKKNPIYSDSINTVQPPSVQYVCAMYLGKPAAAA